MGGLKRIRNDCTFSQDSFRSNLPSEGPYFSIDLKDATDRFPISLQKRILTIATSKDYAETWASIMVDEEFDFQGKKLSYGQGQPMGAFSSFPMFALSHHVILRIAGKRAGKPNYKNYSLLGDDIVLTNHDIVKQYKQILSNLKVSISIHKSYEGNLIEFAKRYIYNGNEVSGFQVGGLLETWRSYPALFGFLKTTSSRGYLLSCASQVSFVKSLYTKMGLRDLSPRIALKYERMSIFSQFFTNGQPAFLQEQP